MILFPVVVLAALCLRGAPVRSAASETLDSDPVAELGAFLKDGPLERIAEQPFAKVTLSAEQAEAARALLVKAAEANARLERRDAFEHKFVALAGVRMDYWYAVYGERPSRGRSLYISLHGGGSGPKEVNEQQWKNQQKLYTPDEGVYVAPRAPTDTWNMWHQGHMDGLLDRLIGDMVLFEGVDPDRVYLMGYSAGGDGVFQLAPRMADRFAAAAMMAGHPNETKPDGLRNLPFAIYMGGKDSAYNRNQIAREWKVRLDDLAAKEPGAYPHQVTIFEEYGHWMERKDASALPWMTGFTRNLRPKRITWLQDDVTERRFYWVCNPEPKPGQPIDVGLEGQTIRVHEDGGAATVAFLLDDWMLDLERPVSVRRDETTLFTGTVPRTIGALAGSLLERGDPRGAFSARLEVHLPIKEPRP